ncbi:MAG: chemotaxis protein CheW [Thermoplasmatota archaeon]
MDIEDKIANSESLQVVIFRLSEDYLACPISQVREIIQLEENTSVPSTPDMIKGIINRRGTIITILDLPKVLNIDLDLNENNSQLMILYSEDEDIGIMVSEVTEIPTVGTEEIEKPSKALETPVNEKYLEGILKKGGNLVLLTDLLKLVDSVSSTELDKAKNFGEGV